MLSKNTFKKGMQLLLLAFPNWKVRLEESSVASFWYAIFKDYDDKRFMAMVKKYIENERFEPTVKGLKDWDVMPRKSKTQIEHEKMLREHGMYD